MPAQDDVWFRVGRIPFTSTIAVVAIGVIGMLLGVFFPAAAQYLVYAPQQLLVGEVWRPFTWPLANSISLWTVLTFLMLWYFGSDLEAQLGKVKAAWLYLGIWASLVVASSLLAFVPSAALGGLQLVQFAVLLVWIAESPQRRFMFGIPAWVFGLVIVGIQVLSLVAARAWILLLELLISLALVAVAARAVGLLSQYSWIPGGRAARAPRPKKPTRSVQRAKQRTMDDESRMDQLLDKINAEGIHSLTKAERAEMEKIRQRRR